ncbi:MAG: hypothetical protein IPL88_03440, partial [Rhizobiales bacterium]|nr:hypothetical protein [Hyphomicrobiales bacterium]
DGVVGACAAAEAARDAAGQRCRAHGVAVKPQPRRRQPGGDFFGNAVESILIDAPHGALSIEARSIVEVSRPARPSSAGESVERVAAAALRERGRLRPTPPPTTSMRAPRRAGRGGSPPTPATACRHRATRSRARASGMARIRADFDYEPEATDVATPADGGRPRAGAASVRILPYHDRRPARGRRAGPLRLRLGIRTILRRASSGRRADATHACADVGAARRRAGAVSTRPTPSRRALIISSFAPWVATSPTSAGLWRDSGRRRTEARGRGRRRSDRAVHAPASNETFRACGSPLRLRNRRAPTRRSSGSR